MVVQRSKWLLEQGENSGFLMSQLIIFLRITDFNWSKNDSEQQTGEPTGSLCIHSVIHSFLNLPGSMHWISKRLELFLQKGYVNAHDFLATDTWSDSH